jgi:transposase
MSARKIVVPLERLQRVEGLSVDIAAARLGVSRSTIKRWRRQVQQSLSA